MRRLVNIVVLLSSLLAVGAVVMWVRSRSTWETVYVSTGNWFWQADSAVGSATLHWYAGWPTPPAHYHLVSDHDPLKYAGPVFAVQFAGASGAKWQAGPFEGEHGTTRVVVDPSGHVRWETAAFPVLRAIATATFSPHIRFWSVTVPYWAVATLLLLPLAGKGVRRSAGRLIGRSRRARGLCPGCGYDVRRATSRCPECGRKFEADDGGRAGP